MSCNVKRRLLLGRKIILPRPALCFCPRERWSAGGRSGCSSPRGQKTPTGYYNVADTLSELIAKGVKVKTCGTCCTARGLGLQDLLEGAEMGRMLYLARWTKESDSVLMF